MRFYQKSIRLVLEGVHIIYAGKKIGKLTSTVRIQIVSDLQCFG